MALPSGNWKRKLLGAGTGGFGAENLETMKAQFEVMWLTCGVQRVLCCVWAEEFCDKWGSGVRDEARPGEEPRQGAQFGKHVL